MKNEWLRPNLFMAATSAVIFLLALVINEVVFPRLDFITGVNWIYLPAGVRLLCTLLFGAAGAFGLLIASWLACFYYFFPDDVLRSFAGGVIATISPYISYRFLANRYQLTSSLRQLTGRRLLYGVILYATVNSTLHHCWLFLVHDIHASLKSFVVMFIGDLLGALIIIYVFKFIIYLTKLVRKST